jgi:hypothetical protein
MLWLSIETERGWLSLIWLTATDCVLRSFKAGDEIIAMDDLYGGT